MGNTLAIAHLPALLTVVRQHTLGKKPAGLPAQLETRTAKSGGRYPASLARMASDALVRVASGSPESGSTFQHFLAPTGGP